MTSPQTKEVVVSTLTGGFPLASILTIIFATAKLLGKISWSWVWVFAPLWIPWAALAIIVAALLVIGLLLGLIAVLFER